MFKDLFLLVIVIAFTSLALLSSSGPGAIAISKLWCFNFIILIKLLKCGHCLWGKFGEQKGKSKINFFPKYFCEMGLPSDFLFENKFPPSCPQKAFKPI